jgi:nucleoid-associated protein YgaU
VRVEPTGEAVIAGRAQPGATVELMRNGTRHDRVVADASGLFVLTPPALPPGEHELSLRFSTPDGLQVVSRQSVMVSVSPTRSERPMIVITAPDQPSVILSMPERASPVAPSTGEAVPAAASATIAVATVEAEGGRLFVSGRGAPSAAVRLYLNESYLASGNADREGRLDFVIERGLPPGDYRVRLDAVDVATGTVKSRAEVTFVMPAAPLVAAQTSMQPASSQSARSQAPGSQSIAPAASQAGQASAAVPPASSVPSMSPPAAPPAASPASSPAQVASAAPEAASASPLVVVGDIRTATVTRGDSLWRISRKLYGQGVRYTVIYAANQNQIRDPDKIYPGQIFVLPQAQ